jgi:hypothetical protein
MVNKMSFVERISALHHKLCEDPEYRKLITAKTDSEAVEGSLFFDTVRAAMMLQKAAGAAGDVGLTRQNLLSDITIALTKLIGPSIDWEKEEREAREFQRDVRAYFGIDEDDVKRLKALRPKPQ